MSRIPNYPEAFVTIEAIHRSASRWSIILHYSRELRGTYFKSEHTSLSADNLERLILILRDEHENGAFERMALCMPGYISIEQDEDGLIFNDTKKFDWTRYFTKDRVIAEFFANIAES